jgi:uncharacterized membrane protein (DUF2068 family)
MYLPLEVYELLVGVTWLKATVFIINAIIVLYLLYILVNRRSSRRINPGC